MTTLAIALGAFVLYLVAYHTYGKWLAAKLFKLDPKAKVPSIEQEDGNDFVPTEKKIIFGHHFTSIAGTGPIVGPALAVIWGWVPALIWVLFGSILIGAVHDFGAIVVSLRNRGQTVGDIAGRVITKRTRILFLTILFLALTIVLAIFGLVIAAVFKMYPQAIFPCLVQIPLAIVIGMTLHRKGVNLLIPSLLTLALMYLSVVFGDSGFLHDFNQSMAMLSILEWVMILLAYSYVASVLPVWTLLQPRDYINSLQLLTSLGLVMIGLVVAALIGGAAVEGPRPALEIVAPAVNWNPEGAPAIFPFLFITIACGAISGFHCLVSSGTTSKQIKCETDAQFVGFGSMLTEGFLAVLVILACVAGLGLGHGSGRFLPGRCRQPTRPSIPPGVPQPDSAPKLEPSSRELPTS
jgi:carbon starvation protein